MKLRSLDHVSDRVLILIVTVAICAIAPAAQQATKTDDTVALTVTITDKTGRYVGGLRRDQIAVLDGDVPQEIIAFEKVNVPVSVVFLFDMPALKRAELVKAARAGLRSFITGSNSANEYVVAGLDSDSSARPFVRDVNSIGVEFDNIAKANLKSKSTLSDALSFGIDKVKSGANGKHVIVFVSNDEGSSALKGKMPELLERVKQSDLSIYAIKLKDVTGTNLKSNAFDELSSTTGGKSFYPATNIELDDTFDILALELTNQYSLVFRPANPTKVSSKWRRLQVSVKPLQIKDSVSGTTTPIPLFARSRSGYYGQP